MTAATVREGVAWALWAGRDATFVEGQYAPDSTELALADVLVSSLAAAGCTVVWTEGLREIAAAAGSDCYSWTDSAAALGVDVAVLDVS